MPSTIGIVSTVQDIQFFTQGYFRTILAAAGKQTIGRDCTLRLVSFTPDEFREVGSARALITAQRCDALLIVAPHETFLPTITALCTIFPAIIISPPRHNLEVSYVATDNYGAAHTVIAHLASRGRRKLALLQPYPLSGDFWERERGYKDGADTFGVELNIVPITYPINGKQINSILSNLPDTLIAPSDNDALPIMNHLKHIGKRIPEDIALVGFDDEDFASSTDPPLTTVRQPISDLAASATSYLIERMAGGSPDLLQEILPNTLIVRGST